MATFTHKTVATQASARVWQKLQLPESWGRISGVTKIDSASFDERGDLIGYRFAAPVGGIDQAGTATRTDHVPGRRMAMNLDSTQLQGAIAIDLQESGSETVVTVELVIEPKGLFPTMMFPAITAAVASRFDETVEAFVTSLNA